MGRHIFPERGFYINLYPKGDFACTFSRGTVTRNIFYSYDLEADMHLMYDYATDKLSGRWFEYVNHHGQSPKLERHHPVILTPGIVYYWAEDIRQPVIYDVASGRTTRPRYQLDDRMLCSKKDSPFFQPFGDQEVFGIAGEGGIELWFFNPNFVPDFLDGRPLDV